MSAALFSPKSLPFAWPRMHKHAPRKQGCIHQEDVEMHATHPVKFATSVLTSPIAIRNVRIVSAVKCFVKMSAGFSVPLT